MSSTTTTATSAPPDFNALENDIAKAIKAYNKALKSENKCISELKFDSDDKLKISTKTRASAATNDSDSSTGSDASNPVVAATGGAYNFSETSSINGSFLNNRMNKHLRRSMFGGGMDNNNSDTLASITELQRMPSYKNNSQRGGSKLSKSDFLKKMKDAGVTSTSTSDFCG